MGTKHEEGSIAGLEDVGDSIDHTAFEQILDMDDDDEERDFSRSIVYGFFEQAENTFKKMDENLEQRNLHELSQLGHFLKGSSATLGLTHVKNSCEKIQHLGHQKDETGLKDQDPELCLTMIKEEIDKLRSEYKKDEKALRKFYGEKPE